jgi:hypothetical protein
VDTLIVVNESGRPLEANATCGQCGAALPGERRELGEAVQTIFAARDHMAHPASSLGRSVTVTVRSAERAGRPAAEPSNGQADTVTRQVEISVAPDVWDLLEQGGTALRRTAGREVRGIFLGYLLTAGLVRLRQCIRETGSFAAGMQALLEEVVDSGEVR